MNISAEGVVFGDMAHAAVVETLLPDFTAEVQLLFSSEREAPFEGLQCPFEGQSGSNQEMEVIGHEHKLMEQVLPLPTIVQEHIEEKLRHSL